MSYIEYTTGIQPAVFDKDDAYAKVQGTRDGAIFSADWFKARCFEGRMFCANGGSITTPITFGAGSIDTTEPDFALYVPSGTTAVIAEILIHMEAYGSTAIFEFMAACGRGGALGTDTDVTPTNLRSDAPFTSNCSVGVASNADATYLTTNISEFWRGGEAVAVTISTADDDSTWQPVNFIWSASTSPYVPVLVGNNDAQLMIYAAAQTGTGYIQVKWAELPSTRIT